MQRNNKTCYVLEKILFILCIVIEYCFFAAHFFRRGKKDKTINKSEGFENLHENEMSNQLGEIAEEMCVESDGPFSMEQLNEDLKSDKGKTSKRDVVKENNEISEGDAQLLSQKFEILDHQLHPDKLEKSFIKDNGMTPKRDEFEKDNKKISKEEAPFSSKKMMILNDPLPPLHRLQKDCRNDKRISQNENKCIPVHKEISEKVVPCSLEKFLLWEGPLVQEEAYESLQDDNYETEDEMASRDGEKEKYTENYQFPVERYEALDGSWDPEKNSDFEANFENAFGKNLKESDAEDPWYRVSSMKIENDGHILKEISYNQLDLESDIKIDAQFNAVFGLKAERYEGIDNYNGDFNMILQPTQRKACSNNPIDDEYNFEDDYEDYGNEERRIETVQKKQITVRDHACKITAFEKFFLYSNIDNMKCVREIKDPLVSIVFVCS